MILTAYQPSYLPWKGLFQRIAQADVFVLCDTDRLSRKDFLTRNRIRTANGDVWLTVPVLGSRSQRICDVRIDDSKPWRRKHWGTIEAAYGKAPYFERFEWWFKHFYNGDRPYELLADLNGATIAALSSAFGWHKGFQWANHLDIPGGGSEFILNVCKHFGADTYLCGAAGRDYLNFPAFEAAGVEVRIQPYQGPSLSAIHHLFTEGPVL